MRAEIDSQLPALLVAPGAPRLDSRLTYRSSDPYAVTLAFGAQHALEGEPVVWVFSRELLATGVNTVAGAGDVRVRPYDPGRTVIELRVPEGSAVLMLPTDGVRAFLRASYEAVPSGAEGRGIPWDAFLATLTEEIDGP
ncbi:SsgA family sporulation/cell division regulator [Kitasatospora mediocidica]|uniref:SsgA family sporulation/cell division regulator n=1 Tax=Kitasatospora mediocidica TaxID=58352 RepID=UPI00056BE5C5|nr:SsgA family sporulation/cell division regulator [Kitasatospora mediocidica]